MSGCLLQVVLPPGMPLRSTPMRQVVSKIVTSSSCTPSNLRSALNPSKQAIRNSSSAAAVQRAPTHEPARQDYASVGLQGEVLTLLHKTRAFLPCALLPHEQAQHFSESLENWNSLLDQVFEDLASLSTAQAQIVVVGADQWSGAEELVKALLEEPFTSESGMSLVVLDEASRGKLMEYSDGSSAYLRSFPLPVKLTKLPPSGREVELPASILYASDIPVVIFHPTNSSPRSLLNSQDLPLSNPYLVLLISSSTTLPPLPTLLKLSPPPLERTSRVSPVPPTNLNVFAVDPLRAAKSLEIIQSNPSSSAAIQRYQDEYMGSRISSLKEILTNFFLSLGDDPKRSLVQRRAMVRISGALLASRSQLRRAKQELDELGIVVSRLEGEVAEVQAKVEWEVLGSCSSSRPASAGTKPTDEVQKALLEAEKSMQIIMHRLTWWRMLLRVDDVGTIVGDAVDRLWCRELERKLVLTTGRLSAVQERLTTSTFASLDELPQLSSLLHNRLRQLQASPAFPLTAQTLTTPLTFRRQQIIDYPTTKLQLAASRATLTVGGSLATGATISWAGWVGWLADVGPLAFLHMDATTSFGAGVLASLVGIRWAVGVWEKAKKRWWEDWHRVGDGLSRDLKSTLQQTVRNNIAVIPEAAITGLLDSMATRKANAADIQDELDTLEEASATIEQRIQGKR
ncbi:hypothetical protein HGRIS_002484 [Hohenbuehelia grisea]|uniref:Mmc1 C-terminal domain-containing protein n=1 Tax=Hohenbuehelia grisea TaxID=104357 RepID=A0ABR3JM06_9AGAR